ncbi:MAG: YdcF family protein, partial [Akkermansiaceae bacterium]|nr:YdcF family protein [Akkermansiaceae bacterium]
MMTVEEAVQIVWDYHLMGHDLQAADLIWALGSHDLRVADRVAELWHIGMAPLVVMSGGLGNFTKGIFEDAEGDLFAERAIELGVPKDVILIENRSANTGENVEFTRKLLDSLEIKVNKVIAVQKPYMERRTFATIARQWEEIEVQVTSPQLSLEEYCGDFITRDELVHILVGDLQRIIDYPKRGFMIEQVVQNDVMEAFQTLVMAG